MHHLCALEIGVYISLIGNAFVALAGLIIRLRMKLSRSGIAPPTSGYFKLKILRESQFATP